MFVSHATSDKWIARVICEKIESTGARTFRDDRDIDGGESIPERIRREIVASQELVVLLTPTSVGRTWVQLEVGAKWGRRKGALIIPILYQVAADRLPGIIQEKRAYQLNDFDEYLKGLRQRLARRKK